MQVLTLKTDHRYWPTSQLVLDKCSGEWTRQGDPFTSNDPPHHPIVQACKVGKLFAKHFKQAEQEAVLSSTVMHVAVGTPNRLIKLIEAGALKLGRLRYVVVDVAMDAKKRCVHMWFWWGG